MQEQSITVYAGNVTLADGTDAGGRVADLKVNGSGVTQIAELFRAAQISSFNRFNCKNEVTVKIQQVQASQIIALQRVFGESDGLNAPVIPIVGWWAFAFTPDGINTLQALIYGGVKIQRQFVGFTTIFTYTITGGQFTITQTVLPIVDGGTAGAVSADNLSDGTGSFTPMDIYDFGSAANP